ncbi:MAG: SMP-30/gluconolactonase/LRE family protein [Halobacteriaceae archaeon]
MTDARYGPEDARVVGADPWLERRLDHPEDVAVGEDCLYAGGEDGQVYRIDSETGAVETLADTGGFVLGVTVGPAGDLYVCDFQRHAVLRLPLDGGTPGELHTVVEGGPADPPWHPNYAVFDRAGRLYVSDSGDRSDMADAGGCVYVVDPHGRGRVLTRAPSAFPNGLALSEDDTLYVAETGAERVTAVGIEGGEATDTWTATEEMGLVDGLAFDAEGRLYGASLGDDAVYRLDDGVETLVHDPEGLTVGNPTNLAFGGPEMHTLYIANLGLWHLTAVDIDARGRPPTPPA